MTDCEEAGEHDICEYCDQCVSHGSCDTDECRCESCREDRASAYADAMADTYD